MSSHDDHIQRALAHVASLSTPGPHDPDLRVTLHFHPDRISDGLTVLASLAGDGRYRSQFETRTSNGGLTAYPGGDRWRWESRMFGGAYDLAPAAARPVYGSLNRHGRDTGGSPRFGSAHLVLRPTTVDRTTFCFPDSVFEPSHFGVAGRMGAIAEAVRDTDDPLDDYVEAQVHGPVRLDSDVEALVLDPCYRGTEVEAVARTLPCPVRWHRGFRLSTEVLRANPGYRGPEFVALGSQLARDGHLDARVIGDAAATGHHDPQALKRVWHYVARFGLVD